MFKARLIAGPESRHARVRDAGKFGSVWIWDGGEETPGTWTIVKDGTAVNPDHLLEAVLDGFVIHKDSGRRVFTVEALDGSELPWSLSTPNLTMFLRAQRGLVVGTIAEMDDEESERLAIFTKDGVEYLSSPDDDAFMVSNICDLRNGVLVGSVEYVDGSEVAATWRDLTGTPTLSFVPADVLREIDYEPNTERYVSDSSVVAIGAGDELVITVEVSDSDGDVKRRSWGILSPDGTVEKHIADDFIPEAIGKHGIILGRMVQELDGQVFDPSFDPLEEEDDCDYVVNRALYLPGDQRIVSESELVAGEIDWGEVGKMTNLNLTAMSSEGQPIAYGWSDRLDQIVWILLEPVE